MLACRNAAQVGSAFAKQDYVAKEKGELSFIVRLCSNKCHQLVYENCSSWVEKYISYIYKPTSDISAKNKLERREGGGSFRDRVNSNLYFYFETTLIEMIHG